MSLQKDMASRFAYIPRTLSYFDANLKAKHVLEHDVLAAFQQPIVILAPPGMGKTRLMERLGEHDNHRFIRATSFLRQPNEPLPVTTRLVIDGLDEVASVSDDDPLHQVLTKLLVCGKPPFVISCRDAEWRGATANLDVAEEYGLAPCQLNLAPLTSSEALAALTTLFEPERAQAALRRLDEVGLEEFYTNPLLLDFVAAIIETKDEIPETRAALYEQAVGQLRLEHNQRHRDRKSGLASLSNDEALDAAGAIMAAMLVTGSDAATFRQDDLSALSITALNGFVRLEALQAIVRSNLFRVAPEQPDHFRPLHRTVAEFVGARWLGRMIEQHGNPARAAARLLALISTDHGIPSSLRGLAAWLPRFSPAWLGPAIIETEPYAVLRYGDPDNLSAAQGEAMLDSLEKLIAFDPYFLAGDWGRNSAKGLVQPALTEKVRHILTDGNATYQMRSIVFDALHKASGHFPFTSELEAITLDTSRLEGERSGALNVLIARNAKPNWHGLIAALLDHGDTKSTEMAIRTIAKLGPGNFSAKFIVRAIVADAQLRSAESRAAMMTIGTMSHFESSIPDNLVEPLLDELAAQLAPMRDPKRWWQHDNHPGWREVSSLAAFLIRRQLELTSASLTPEKLFGWMCALMQEHDRDRDDKKVIAEFFKNDDQLRRGIQRLALFGGGTQTEFHANHWHLSRLSHGLLPTAEDAKLHLAELVARNDPADQHWWFALLNQLRGEDRLIPKPVQKMARPFAGDAPDLLRFLRCKPERTPQDEWTKKHHRSMRERERRKQQNWQKARINFAAHADDVRAGELRWMSNPAKAYLGMFSDLKAEEPLDRLVEWLGDDVANDVLQGFESALHRQDLPTPEQVANSYAESKYWHWIHPLIAAAGRRVLNGKEFADLSEDVLIVLALAIEHEGLVERKGHKDLPAQLTAELKARGAAYGRYIQLKFEPMFTAKRTHVAGLYAFLRARDERPYSTQWAMRWVEEFQDLPLEVDQELVECLLNAPNAEHEEAWRKLREVAARKLAGCPPGSDEETFWRSIEFTIDPASAIAAIPQPGANSRATLWSFSRHLYSRYNDSTRVPAQTIQLEWLLRSFRGLWPYVERPSGVTSGDQNPWDATELLRWTIFELGKDIGADATRILADLRAMPKDGYTETIQAAIAQQQRSRLEANFQPPTFDDLNVVLTDQSPRSASDVQAIVLEAMARFQERLRGDPLNVVNNFYNEHGTHKDENACRDQMLIALGLLPYGIQFHPESAMPQGNRADSGFAFGTMLVPLEAKGQWHQDVWTAPSRQLDRLYASDYRASSKGIYVVFWFGDAASRKTPPKGVPLPGTPMDMQISLVAGLPADRRADIAVVVLDVTRPAPKPKAKSPHRARSVGQL